MIPTKEMSKLVGTNITANTVSGYGTIHKLYGNTVEEGTGEKSPSNPYTLKCVADDVNLFDKSTVTLNKYINNEGTLVSVNTWSVTDYIPCQPQTQYIASGYTDLGGAPCRRYYNKNKNPISVVQHNRNPENMAFTTPENCYYFQESVYRDDLDTFKIQKGSVATPYTPFNGEGTVEIISKNGDQQSSNAVVIKPLCCLKDSEGNVIAQDYIDYSKGVVHRECGYMVLNGSEAWKVREGGTTYAYQLLNGFDGNRVNGISNCFKFKQGGATTNQSEECIASANSDTSINVFTNNSNMSTLETFKTWLSSNPITVVYQLATPTTEHINCSNKIVQYNGETTVSNRDGAKIEVSLTNNNAISQVNEELGGLRDDVNKVNEYSTEEKRIGTWIDGKPIYKKTIKGTFINDAEFHPIINNVKELVKVEGTANTRPFTYFVETGSNTGTVDVVVIGANLTLRLRNTSILGGTPYTLTFYYTKTTD